MNTAEFRALIHAIGETVKEVEFPAILTIVSNDGDFAVIELKSAHELNTVLARGDSFTVPLNLSIVDVRGSEFHGLHDPVKRIMCATEAVQ